MRYQNTIKSPIEFESKGLHSGNKGKIILKPADENVGIVFIYKDNNQNEIIPFNLDSIKDTRNNISVGNDRATIKTVEHLMAALYAMQIDNCIIECYTNEIPIMDGSTKDFIEGIISVGVVKQNALRKVLNIINPIWIDYEDKFIIALPYNGLKISYTISFPNSPIGTQSFLLEINKKNYLEHLCNARTFGFIEDLDYYQKNGLVLGGDFDNVHVFSKKQNKPLNEPRYNDEPVRHKIVDLIGGISVLNMDINAFLISYKGGHYLDIQFAKKINSIIKDMTINNDTYNYITDSSYYYFIEDLLNSNKIPS